MWNNNVRNNYVINDTYYLFPMPMPMLSSSSPRPALSLISYTSGNQTFEMKNISVFDAFTGHAMENVVIYLYNNYWDYSFRSSPAYRFTTNATGVASANVLKNVSYYIVV